MQSDDDVRQCPGCGESLLFDPAMAGDVICPYCAHEFTMFEVADIHTNNHSADELHIDVPSPGQAAIRRLRSARIKRGGLSDIFDVGFHKFITPAIVKVIYVSYLVIVALLTALMFFALVRDESESIEYKAIQLIGYLIGSFFFLLIIRLSLEATMVLFRMEEHLGEIRDGK